MSDGREQKPAEHEYVSAGDVAGASGDRPYTGCYICGRSRREHQPAKKAGE